jgi:hypothetical protein
MPKSKKKPTENKEQKPKYDYIRNLPEKYRKGGFFGQNVYKGRPKLTEEEIQERKHLKAVEAELKRISAQQKYDIASIYDEISKSGGIKLMLMQMMERSAEVGNPNVLKFVAQILGNLEQTPVQPPEIKIVLHREL